MGDDADIVTLLRGLVYGEHVSLKAADTIEFLREQLGIADRTYWEKNREIEALKEKLQMAQTEAKDVNEFREREKKHAEAVMVGMQMAFGAVVHAVREG